MSEKSEIFDRATEGSTKLFRISATHVSERLRMRDIRERLTEFPIDEFTNYNLTIRLGEFSFAFIYNYGTVVFFNVPTVLQDSILQLLRETKEAAGIGDTTEAFLMEEVPTLAGAPNQVRFDRVICTKITFAKIKLVSMLVAESSALDYYDILIENLLERATQITKRLERDGKFIDSKEDLLKFVGLCLSSKQEIIANLYIVDTPEETWEDSELDRIYHDLKVMLEVDTRYRAVEYKSKIIQESVEVITDLLKSKRETTLEITIIALIAFEIVMNLIHAIRA